MIIGTVLNELGYPEATANISFVDTPSICNLHKEHFDDASPTNVISFEYGVPPAFAQDVLGEVVIAFDVAADEAKMAGLTVEQRIAQLLIHGMLHVAGHEHVNVDKDTKNKMENEEARIWRMVEPLLNELAV